MTKKIISLFTCLLMITAMYAQKANILSTINYLKESDVANAKKLIDETVVNESTKSNAKAWLLRGVVYQAIATPSEYMPQMQFVLNDNLYNLDLVKANALAASTPNAFSEAIESYKKSFSLDAKYSKEELMPLLSGLLYLSYNEGISQMNSSKFNDAIKSFENAIAVSQIDGGKPFKGITSLDTIMANVKLYQANSYYQLSKEDMALPLLEESVKNPITQNADIYVMMAEIYERKNNSAKWTEIMKEGKAKFPGEKRLINSEINYYVKQGKGEESIAKLKEGIAAEPNKIDLYIILGQTYYGLANPVDADGKSKPAPANAKELEQNAINAYTKAISIDANNPYPHFYTGIVHFNNAKAMTDEMNKADDKRYKEIEPKRNAKLNEAIPFLEKTKSLIEAGKVDDSNKEMYKQVLGGLSQAYMITDQTEKSTQMQNLLKSVK